MCGGTTTGKLAALPVVVHNRRMDAFRMPDLKTVPDNAERIASSDSALRVEFYRNPVDDMDHIRIFFPGDPLTQPDFLASPHYQQRFARQWARYQASQDQDQDQTVLEQVAWIDEATRRVLHAANIFSIEQLVGTPDDQISLVGPGMRALQERGRRMMEERATLAATPALEARVKELEAQLTELLQMSPTDIRAIREAAGKLTAGEDAP